MRAVFISGSIALYIACAFVPPSQANFHAFAAMAKDLSTLDSEAVVARVVDGLHETNVRPLIDAAYHDANVSTLVDAASEHVESLMPDPKTVLKTIAHSVIGERGQTASLALLIESENDSGLRSQFERINWAASKRDPRLCRLLSEFYTQEPDAGFPTLGDLLALCLAETTRESVRCDQIDAATAPALRETCRNDLEIQV